MSKPSIAVFGNGRIGAAAAFMLREAGYRVGVFDEEEYNAKTFDDFDVYLAATPFSVCEEIAAEAAIRHNKLYFDLTEDVDAGREIRARYSRGTSIFVPHCGVAPGAVSVIAGSFGPAHKVEMMVGALPTQPTGRLNYALNWSTNGLVNEYINPCPVIRNWAIEQDAPLVDAKLMTGDDYESFSTSGGIGTFCDTRKGMVANACYRTIRYAGHADYIRFLLEDMRYSPDALEIMLDNVLPHDVPDKVIVKVYGQKDTASPLIGYSRTIFSGQPGRYDGFSAIQQATAAGVVAVMQWIMDNPDVAVQLVRPGNWIANEDIPLSGVEKYDCWRHVYGTFIKGDS